MLRRHHRLGLRVPAVPFLAYGPFVSRGCRGNNHKKSAVENGQRQLLGVVVRMANVQRMLENEGDGFAKEGCRRYKCCGFKFDHNRRKMLAVSRSCQDRTAAGLELW